VVSVVRALITILKWATVAVAYVLLGLLKLATIVIVLAYFSGRAGLRRLLDARERRDAADEQEYDLGYPPMFDPRAPMAHGSDWSDAAPIASRDAFDPQWQRERDVLLARRQGGTAGRAVTGGPEGYHDPLP
jgi:hypothetical protein